MKSSGKQLGILTPYSGSLVSPEPVLFFNTGFRFLERPIKYLSLVPPRYFIMFTILFCRRGRQRSSSRHTSSLAQRSAPGFRRLAFPKADGACSTPAIQRHIGVAGPPSLKSVGFVTSQYLTEIKGMVIFLRINRCIVVFIQVNRIHG